MKTLLSILLTIYAAGTDPIDPRNIDVPFITAILEQGDGSKISLRYKAVHWIQSPNPDAQTNVGAPPNANEPANAGGQPNAEAQPNPGRLDLQNNLNHFHTQMATLETNVQLKIGVNAFDPGRYYLGIVQQANRWIIEVSDGRRPVIRQLIPMKEDDEVATHLSFNFRPGLTNRDFLFDFHYGTLSTSFRWTISGIPVRMLENAGSITDTTGEHTRSTGNDSINRLNSRLDDQKKEKAGSGAFRRIYKNEKDDQK